MKFDTVIIGGGLAGLLCGLELTRQGLRCAIISRGQSGLHFSSGSLDLLAHSPDCTTESALEALAATEPTHPYSLLGKTQVLAYARRTEALLSECGITMQGDIGQPHQRITPIGILRQAWLTPEDIALAPKKGERIAVVGISGFLDFQPHLVAASLRKTGAHADALEIELPQLDALRENASEFRSVNLARVLDGDNQSQSLLSALLPIAKQYDRILMPACFGLQDNTLWRGLNESLPCPLSLLPTLPPSVPGIRLHTALQRQFVKNGGVWLAGDAVTDVIHDGQNVSAISTRNHGEIPLRSRFTVLASGSFFSNGLVASRQGVSEPVLGLDVLQTAPRESWSRSDFFEPQPWQRFGVKTDSSLRASLNGETFNNLFAIGGVLAGFDGLSQGCAGGVSAVTALHVARQITELSGEQP
ncbi:glycerol-3-phosphate dehydrogenase subunit GlpB [Enterobacteriaceae bacterium C23F]